MLINASLRVQPDIHFNLWLLTKFIKDHGDTFKLACLLQILLGDRQLKVECLVKLLAFDLLGFEDHSTPVDSGPDLRVPILRECVLCVDLQQVDYQVQVSL